MNAEPVGIGSDTAGLLQLEQQLIAAGAPFAVVTVIRAAPPTSTQVGAQALVDGDGTLHGWIGGGCARAIVIEAARQSMRAGQPRRVRISNELGTAPLTIAAGTARLLGGGGGARPLRFDRRASVTVPPGGVLLSDPVPLRAPALGEVAVSLYFPTPARPAVRRTAVRVVKGQAEVPDSKALAYRQNVISALYVQPPHPRQPACP